MIREGETSRIPLQEDTVPIILIHKDGTIEEANFTTAKIVLLGRVQPDETLIAIWPGRWRTDTFTLDHAQALAMMMEFTLKEKP